MKNLLKKLIPKSVLLFYHKILALLAALFYRFPSQELIVIGVTGTTGKTSTCNMIAKILEEAGFKVGLTTTVNFKIGAKEWINLTKQTMLGRFRLQKLLRQMVDAGCDYAVIETSSEGILQSRHLGINYDVAVFTNLSPEHIESHGSFEKYRQAKEKLFKSLKQKNKRTKKQGNKEIKKVSVINLDDPNAEYFLKYDADEKYGYGINFQFPRPTSPGQSPGGRAIPPPAIALLRRMRAGNSQSNPNPPVRPASLAGGPAGGQNPKLIKAENVEVNASGSNFIISAYGGPTEGGHDSKFTIPLLGEFNIYNALAAICVGLSQGINLEVAAKALKKIAVIPGRMEFIDCGQKFKVIVDYAHEPKSLEAVYKTINSKLKTRNSKLISVLGACGGGRDRSKRPILGKLASKYTDYVIVTNEDPYDEDPVQIINEVFSGVVKISNFQFPISKQILNSKFQISNFKERPLSSRKESKSQINSRLNQIIQNSNIQNTKSQTPNIKIENVNAWRILDRRKAIKKALKLAGPNDIVIITGKGSEQCIVGKNNQKIPWDERKEVRVLLQERIGKQSKSNTD